MEELTFRHLTSETSDGVLVLTLTDAQLRGDDWRTSCATNCSGR